MSSVSTLAVVEGASCEGHLRPFYFTVVFWGARHRGYFTDLLVASLLSPNNIPSLKRDRRSKFLIVTTKQDWEVLQRQHLFQQLCQYVEPVFLEMPFPNEHDLKMLVMSKGHKQVSLMAYKDEAYGVYLAPDLILSDGSVAAMERLAEQGEKVVLCVAIRFCQETLLPALEQSGFLKAERPLAISSRELMALALRNLHTETLRYEFDAAYFADYPISVFWWETPGRGMIIHSFSWAPLVVDYGHLKAHDTSTFEKWTLDGDYIFRNFPEPSDVYVVNDSDEIALVSFTKESELHFDLVPDPKKANYGVLTETYKIGLVRSLLSSDVMDPLKRRIFPQRVLLHSEPITATWDAAMTQSAKIVRDVCRSPTKEDQFHLDIINESGNGPLVKAIVEQLAVKGKENVSKTGLRKFILVWVLFIRPKRFFTEQIVALERLLRGKASWTASLLWFWRYRRFLWWRLKEKLGIVEERGYRWQDGGWAEPDLSLMCPLFSINWLWTHRAWVWKNRHLWGSWLKHNYGFAPILSKKKRHQADENSTKKVV